MNSKKIMKGWPLTGPLLLFILFYMVQAGNAQTYSSYNNEPFYAEPYSSSPYNLNFGFTQRFKKINDDTNGDGIMDVVYLYNNTLIGTQYGVVLFDENGPKSNIQFNAKDVNGINVDSRGMTYHDFNGDGKKDFAYNVRGSDIVIRYYTGTNASGVPQYTNPVALGLSFTDFIEVSALEAADINGDGTIDIVVTGANNGIPKIVLNNGDGTFSGYELGLTKYYQNQIVVVDIDNDSDLDLVIVDYDRKIILYKNNGNNNGVPQYVSSILFNEVSEIYESVLTFLDAVDLNNDGKIDFIFNIQKNNAVGEPRTLFYINSTANLSSGSFSFVRSKITHSSNNTNIAGYNSLFQDIDNDGIKDILGSNNGEGDVFFGWVKLAIDPSTKIVSVKEKLPIFHLGPQTVTNLYGQYLFQGDMNGDNQTDYLLHYLGSTSRRLVYYKTKFPDITISNLNPVSLNDRIFISGYKDDQITVSITSNLAGALNSTASDGGTVSGSGTNSITITGTVQQINNTLGLFAYTPGVVGIHDLSISVTNSGNETVTRHQLIKYNNTLAKPTNLSAILGNGQLEISFTPGASGAIEITNYEYTLDGGLTWIPFNPARATSPVIITSLTNGISYTVQLRAVSAVGVSPESDPVTATPSPQVPAAPTNLTVTPKDGQLEISFTAGSDRGSAITNYEYQLDNGTWVPFNPADATSPVTIPGLTNAIAYTIKLRAVNDVGVSLPSQSVSGTPATVPSAPTDLSATAYNGEL
jgi:hypothetical protein